MGKVGEGVTVGKTAEDMTLRAAEMGVLLMGMVGNGTAESGILLVGTVVEVVIPLVVYVV
jgi:high-affinity Fe2+/Pb2+ permease